jgi:hypothetical protein
VTTATLRFDVVEPRGIEHPMIAGQVARIATTVRFGGASQLRGQPVVIVDAHRHTTDGPLWLDVHGIAAESAMGPLRGKPLACVMRASDTDALISEWLPGEYRVRECTSIRCEHASCWVLTVAHLVGEPVVTHIEGSAGDAAVAAWAAYDEHVRPRLPGVAS